MEDFALSRKFLTRWNDYERMGKAGERLKLADTAITAGREETVKKRWRQRYHFMAPVGWMNDPNGLIVWRNEYHLFYQFNPFSANWGAMHWGHAVSKDMCRWEYLPTALAPSEEYDDWEEGGCFSGCAVENNGNLTLIYTGTSLAESGVRQVQCLAESVDGINFYKFPQNPVISSYPGCASNNFRDPKVWKKGELWYLVCGSGKDGKGMALLYCSRDLIAWEFMNILAESDGTQGYMWECPDVFELDGQTILVFSPMGAGEHQCMYMSGKLDYSTGNFREQFRGDVDYGQDYYAAQSFLDQKGRRILFGWCSSWDWMPWFTGFGASQTEGWCGHLSIPREARLRDDGGLKFVPVNELEDLRKRAWHMAPFLLRWEERERVINAGDGIHVEILMKINLEQSTADKMILQFRKTPEYISVEAKRGALQTGHATNLILDFAQEKLYLDFAMSDGKKKGMCAADIRMTEKYLDVRIFLDSCSAEVFADDYRIAMTANIFPDEKDNGITISSTGGDTLVEQFDVWEMTS